VTFKRNFFKLSEREKFADEWIARTRGFRDDDNFGGEDPCISRAREQILQGFPATSSKPR